MIHTPLKILANIPIASKTVASREKCLDVKPIHLQLEERAHVEAAWFLHVHKLKDGRRDLEDMGAFSSGC